MMAEPMATVGPEQEMPVLPENKVTDAKDDGGDLQTLPKDHTDNQSSQLGAEPDLTRKSESVKIAAEHDISKELDDTHLDKPTEETHLEKTTDNTPLENLMEEISFEKQTVETPLEKRTDGAPSDKKTDDAPSEKQTDDAPSVKLTGDALPEKQTDDALSVKLTGDALLEKQTDDMPSENQTDDIPLEKQTNDMSLETQRDEMSLEKQTDNTPLEKQADDTPVNNQTDDRPFEKQKDNTSLEKQTDDMSLEKQTDDAFLGKHTDDQVIMPTTHMETDSDQSGILNVKAEAENGAATITSENKTISAVTDVREPHPGDNYTKTPSKEEQTAGDNSTPIEGSNQSFIFEPYSDGDDSGTEEEQVAFMKELENFYRERSMEFKPPKFYGEALNCLKLWRTVTRLGGYDQVTACKLWRQVGESFKPPKTCTTISWSFRIFFEKALLEYEKHKIQTGELKFSMANLPGSMSVDNQVGGNQGSGSGRARRDAAARAMQGWHAQRLLNGEDKNSLSFMKRGTLKKRKAPTLEDAVKVAKTDPVKRQGDVIITDAGAPADWVKINVLRTKEFFEVYALVPGLLREEVQVQSDPAGRLIISGDPEQRDNPWGVTPFKKVITLPSRINPHQTSAVVSLHGQLFVRAPIDESDV
ncbi:AT-rich interactive domain-containing protein 5-like isoform X2 [Musa acuminata AAA Group]|uniref:AT-rich interactive domain-containing protein 5-like isoform X2 n=1 Tax=Musa acuminata AAA Group TaxID=214697 RepID=UPI0031CF75E6